MVLLLLLSLGEQAGREPELSECPEGGVQGLEILDVGGIVLILLMK